jgi:cyclohexyl-isocyanide hydratase
MLPTARLEDCPAKLDVFVRSRWFWYRCSDARRGADFVSAIGRGAVSLHHFCLCRLAIASGSGSDEGVQGHNTLGSARRADRASCGASETSRSCRSESVSGGGVTAGTGFGLTVLAELRGENVAKAVQPTMEYNPEPPFDAGSPEKAGEQVVAPARGLMARLRLTAPLRAREGRADL